MSAINPNKPDNNLEFEVPKEVQKAQNIYETVDAGLCGVSSAVLAYDQAMKNVPPVVTNSLGALSIFSSAIVVFAIPNLISSISKMIFNSSIVERVKHAFNAVFELGTIASAVNYLLLGLKSIGVIAKDAIPWTSIVGTVLFPIQFIMLGLDIHQAVEHAESCDEIRAKITYRKGLKEHKIQDLTESCEYIVRNHAKIREVLTLSKKTETVIDQKAQEILKGLRSEDKEAQEAALLRAEEMMKIFKRRISTTLYLEAATVSVKVAGVAVGAISLFVPPNPVLMVAAGVCGVALVAIFGLGKLLLNKDPFSAPKDVWYEKMAHKTREFVYDVANAPKKLRELVANRV